MFRFWLLIIPLVHDLCRRRFSDDKPVVVVTHGDLLSLSERVRVRVHLGELLGIHPKTQIFDIPGGFREKVQIFSQFIQAFCLHV